MTWPINYQSPLMLEGWLEFNRYKWGVVPLRIRLNEGKSELPAIEAVLYLDKRGQIIQPPLNPYLPVAFYPTPTNKQARIYRQWMSLSKMLVEEFKQRGIKGSVAFPPEVQDVRPWQWNGFWAEVRFTFYLNLPHSIDQVDYSDRRRINKADRSGFKVELVEKDALQDVCECLLETEERQGFAYKLSKKDLEAGLDIVGELSFRIYLCRADNGEPASARVVIACPGLRAIDWIAGTKKKYLSSGATQFLIFHVLDDLSRVGAVSFDFSGANLPTVSAAKADWGGILTPYYAVRPLNLRTVIALGFRMIQSRLGRK